MEQVDLNNFKAFHMIGIGGVSMSAIAKYLHFSGFIVSGSDAHPGRLTEELIRLGIKVFPYHGAENVTCADAVIYNSAIKPDNPELIEARRRGIQTIGRMDFLSAISKRFKTSVGIAGCHGKTTATAMLSHVLLRANKKFAMTVGGEDNFLGNFYYSGDDLFVSEICEFDRNTDKFSANIACVLNVGYDHADCYKNIYDIRDTYFSFLNRAECRVVNGNDGFLSEYPSYDIVFGVGKGFDVSASDIRLCGGKAEFTVKCGNDYALFKPNAYGEHNVYNALAAASLALRLGVGLVATSEALGNFSGIKRRFENTGRLYGADVICDYAHHPTEIKASLETAKKLGYNRIFTIFQPHTYTRTKALMEEFSAALSKAPNPSVYATYAAREEYDAAGSAKALFDTLPNAENYFDNAESMFSYLSKKITPGDLVLVLGAGDIYDIIRSASCL